MLKEMTATASQGARRGTAVATVPSRMGSIVSAFLTRPRGALAFLNPPPLQPLRGVVPSGELGRLIVDD